MTVKVLGDAELTCIYFVDDRRVEETFPLEVLTKVASDGESNSLPTITVTSAGRRHRRKKGVWM